MIKVRQHTRRKPAKKPDPFQSEIDRLLAVRRGERPVSAYAAVFRKLARAIGLEARV